MSGEREEIRVPLGFTGEGEAVIATIQFSHKLRPGMLRRLAASLKGLADIADEELPPLMGRDDYERVDGLALPSLG